MKIGIAYAGDGLGQAAASVMIQSLVGSNGLDVIFFILALAFLPQLITLLIIHRIDINKGQRENEEDVKFSDLLTNPCIVVLLCSLCK